MQTETHVVAMLIVEVKAQLARTLHVLDAMGLPGAAAYICSAMSLIDDEISTGIDMSTMAQSRSVDSSYIDQVIEQYLADVVGKNDSTEPRSSSINKTGQR